MFYRNTFISAIAFALLLTACASQEETKEVSEPLHKPEALPEEETLEEVEDGTEDDEKRAFSVPDISAPDVSLPEHIRPPRVSAPEVSISMEENKMMMEVPEHLLFDFDEATLKEEAKDILVEISEELAQYEKAEIEIYGHTDNVGDASYNQRLSERRAEAVAAFLVAQEELHHINFSTKGFGESRPLVSNDTEENRAKNRRVEIIVHLLDES